MNTSTKALAIAIALAAASPAAADPSLQDTARRLFGRVDAADPAAVASPEARLGRALFWDARISLDGKTACATCHKDQGADRRAVSIDARGKPMGRHSPTVFNATSQTLGLRWLADRKDAAILSEGLITGPLGFASKQDGVESLRRHGYADAFRAAFPGEADPVSATNYARALAAYQATLATPAPFDRFLAGDGDAIDARQKRGLRAFVESGCAACHNGPLLGGRSFSKFGITADYWTLTGSTKQDPGLAAVTKKDEDRHVFRVPMLRNVARTAPYFHDGSVEKLEDAVAIMAKLQLGRTLDARAVGDIVAFLESLTGDTPAHFAPPADARTAAR